MPNEQMTNSQIMNAVLKGTNLYQLGVPDPTQVGVERTYRYMMSPNNHDVYNTFVSGLFRLIGTQLIRNREYINPLATFKRVNVNRKQTIQEIGFHLVKARAYDQFDVDKFFEEHPPVIDAAYHSQNRQDKYKISINPELLENAFLQEYGLSNFVSGALQQPINSDNHDEYNIMLDLIAKYESRWGFYKIQVPEITGTTQGEVEFATKQFIKAVRTIAGNWALDYSGLYNGYHLPVFTPLGKTYLITTPDIMASVDVDVLAAAFNMSSAELQQRTVLVSKIPVDNCYALLVDEDWFVCGDTLYENRSWENPETLTMNYFLHHWSVLSTSPMLNCVAFVTTQGTVNKEINVTPTTFSFGLFDEDGNPVEKVAIDKKTYVKGSLKLDVVPEGALPSSFTPATFEINEIRPFYPAEADLNKQDINYEGTVNVDVNTFATTMKLKYPQLSDYHLAHCKVTSESSQLKMIIYGGWGSETVSNLNLTEWGISVDPALTDGQYFIIEYSAERMGSPIELNSRTYIDKYGMIHLQAAAKDAHGGEITIYGYSTYNTDGVGNERYYSDINKFRIE